MKLIRKLKSKKGESFVELLIAILIVAFGCMIIAAMYSAAFNLNVKAAEEDTAFYGAISDMEQMNNGGTTKKEDVVMKDNNGNEYETDVEVYGDDANTAYRKGD